MESTETILDTKFEMGGALYFERDARTERLIAYTIRYDYNDWNLIYWDHFALTIRKEWGGGD